MTFPLAGLLAAPSAHAQVTIDLHALQGLAPGPAPSARRPTRPAVPERPLPLPPIPPGAPGPPPAPAERTVAGTSIGPLPRPPPKMPPGLPVIAPVMLVGPPHPEPIPRPPAVVATAPGVATRIEDGLRVTFGGGDRDLNPATFAALKRFATAAAKDDAQSVVVSAYAPGDPSDPSTSRRLSLARALAARALLREAGVPSERIYVRALLARPSGALPANRVDVTITPARTAAKGSR
ncbi:MAG: OmpA family protein [Acetobacteraceae bacterium]